MDFADIEWLIGALFAFIPGIIDFLGDPFGIKGSDFSIDSNHRIQIQSAQRRIIIKAAVA